MNNMESIIIIDLFKPVILPNLFDDEETKLKKHNKKIKKHDRSTA